MLLLPSVCKLAAPFHRISCLCASRSLRKALDFADCPRNQSAVLWVCLPQGLERLNRAAVALPGYDLNCPLTHSRVLAAEGVAYLRQHRRSAVDQHPLCPIGDVNVVRSERLHCRPGIRPDPIPQLKCSHDGIELCRVVSGAECQFLEQLFRPCQLQPGERLHHLHLAPKVPHNLVSLRLGQFRLPAPYIIVAQSHSLFHLEPQLWWNCG